MKEITSNLRQDVKDLLNESANVVTGFLRRGVCTVQAVAGKWKTFAHDISSAVDALVTPSLMERKYAPVLSPDAEPSVIVRESTDKNFPVSMCMPLSQANELVGRIDREYCEAEYTTKRILVQIDYMKDGQPDCYYLPLYLGSGGDLLEQMKRRVDNYRSDPGRVSRLFESAPEEHRAELEAAFTPAIQESLKDLSGSVLQFFRRHCEIAALEHQFQGQATVLSEKERTEFEHTAAGVIMALRREANTGQPQAPMPTVKGDTRQNADPQREDGQRPRQSVKVKLRQIKEGQAAQPQRKRQRQHSRPRPQR